MKSLSQIKGVSDVFFDIDEPKKKGIAKILKRSISETESMFSKLRSNRRLFGVEVGDYIVLKLEGFGVMMSDTQLERRTNIDFINKANGKVMIAGLGIGFIIENIREKIVSGEITEVVIYEKYQDVIDLVSPYYRELKLTIIKEDIMTYIPKKGETYDCIYFDIWETISQDNLEDMAILHRRWCKRLNKNNEKKFMDSWMKSYLTAERRREKRRESNYYW